MELKWGLFFALIVFLLFRGLEVYRLWRLEGMGVYEEQVLSYWILPELDS